MRRRVRHRHDEPRDHLRRTGRRRGRRRLLAHDHRLGHPTPTFTVTSGELPAGLTLDAETDTISGEPTASGTSDVTITVSNGTEPDATADYSLVVAAAPVDGPAPAEPDDGSIAGSPDDTEPGTEARLLASSGSDAGAAPLLAVSLATLGAGLLLLRRRVAAGSRTSR